MKIESALLFLLTFWLAVLSVIYYILYTHYKNLTGNNKGADLKKILDKILSAEKNNDLEIIGLHKKIDDLVETGKLSISKVGLVRFNPFHESGGYHSFSVAIMNGFGDGFVLTGLHTREMTRFYIKEVKKGEVNTGLSREEKKAIMKALTLKI